MVVAPNVHERILPGDLRHPRRNRPGVYRSANTGANDTTTEPLTELSSVHHSNAPLSTSCRADGTLECEHTPARKAARFF